VKAFLVIRNFMNLRGSTPLTVLWAALGFIWLLLMGGIFLDYRTAPNHRAGRSWNTPWRMLRQTR
jgi:hypothetical protein